MLDYGFMMSALVAGRFDECRIEDLLFDRGVHCKSIADVSGELLFFPLILGFGVLGEPPFHLSMIGFEQADRVGVLAAHPRGG
jgi:hypothetical protein